VSSIKQSKKCYDEFPVFQTRAIMNTGPCIVEMFCTVLLY